MTHANDNRSLDVLATILEAGKQAFGQEVGKLAVALERALAEAAAPPPDRTAWEKAVADLADIEARLAATNVDDEVDRLSGDQHQLWQTILATPAPDGAALAWKLARLLPDQWTGGEMVTGDRAIAQTLADVQRFLGQPTSATAN